MFQGYILTAWSNALVIVEGFMKFYLDKHKAFHWLQSLHDVIQSW